jgi:hypothetical protein
LSINVPQLFFISSMSVLFLFLFCGVVVISVLCVCLFVRLFVCLFVRLCICLCVCVCAFVCLFVVHFGDEKYLFSAGDVVPRSLSCLTTVFSFVKSCFTSVYYKFKQRSQERKKGVVKREEKEIMEFTKVGQSKFEHLKGNHIFLRESWMR